MKNKGVLILAVIIVLSFFSSFLYSEFRQYGLRNEVQKLIYDLHEKDITFKAHKNNHYWYYFYIPDCRKNEFLDYYKVNLESKGWKTKNYDMGKKYLNMIKSVNGVNASVLIRESMYKNNINFYIGLYSWDT